MAETRIEWADFTFNPWIGCTKVSEACRNCYAERDNNFRKWNGGTWGPGAPRKVTSEANWRRPLQWNHQAILDGVQRRVFTASLADVFDSKAPQDAQVRLFDLIEECDALDWLVLTKRPENALSFFAERWGHRPSTIPPHLWIGTSVENQKEADKRIPILMRIPAAVRFLSMEPLLGPVDLSPWLRHHGLDEATRRSYALAGEWPAGGYIEGNAGIDWVITGGESGPNARASHPEWFRSLRDQCVAAGVPFFFKQWGEWAPGTDHPNRVTKGSKTQHIGFHRGRNDVLAARTAAMVRVGKKTAGRLLDGEEWGQVPSRRKHVVG